MRLGDFFQNASTCRPVNARPVTLTAVSRVRKNGILPGGAVNTTGKPVAATVKAMFCLIDKPGHDESRRESRRYLVAKYNAEAAREENAETLPLQPDVEDYNSELVYQLLWRALYEQVDEKTAGEERLFPTVDMLRELVDPPEANRVLGEYNKYVADEFPQEGAVKAKTFRGAGRGGKAAPGSAPG